MASKASSIAIVEQADQICSYLNRTAATGRKKYSTAKYYSSIKERVDHLQFQSHESAALDEQMPEITRNPERRNSRRFEVPWDLVVTGKDHFNRDLTEAATLANLSSSGAFFYFPRRLDLGEAVELRIRVPFKSDNWMNYAAEVVRVEERGSVAGVAARFDEPRPLFIVS